MIGELQATSIRTALLNRLPTRWQGHSSMTGLNMMMDEDDTILAVLQDGEVIPAIDVDPDQSTIYDTSN